MTPLPLVLSDGGRAAAGLVPAVTNKDCVTRAIAIGDRRPYTEVHQMVTQAGRDMQLPDAAENGVNLNVAAKLLHDLGWRPVPEVRNASLTQEDLETALRKHPVLIVETLAGHLTAVVNGAVHDLQGMSTATDPAHARTDQLAAVYAPPDDGRARVPHVDE
ncbi:hypothetical protein [Mycobacterium gordonae]|nr:hypothetical protein [Mycobacterium gordonae]